MQADAHHCPPSKRKFVIIVAFLASAMGFIDGTIIAIALPNIRVSLDTSFIEAQWIANAYLLTLSAFILLGGGLGDKLGIRRVFSFGLIVFVATSLACVVAWDAQSLIVFRALQGIGSAIMLPCSMALIARNTPKSERGKAMGIWVAASSITTAIGPFLGGLLLTYGGGEAWRLIFAINLPIGLLALFLLQTQVPNDEPQQEGGVKSLDWTGGALLTLALGAIAIGLTFLAEDEAQTLSVTFLIVGLLISVIAIGWERKAASPMIDMGLFCSVGFSGANLVTSLIWTSMGAVTFFLPMLVIVGWKLPPAYAGSMFLPFSIMITILSPAVGGMVDRFGTRLLLSVGSLIFGAGCLGIAWAIAHQDYWWGLLPGFTILGLGISMMGTTVAAAVVNTVPEHKTGAASGINNMVSRMAFLFAIAGLGALVAHRYAAAIRAGSLPPDIEELMVQAGFGERLSGGLYQIATVDLQAAAMNQAMLTLFLTLAAMAFIAVPISYLTQDR